MKDLVLPLVCDEPLELAETIVKEGNEGSCIPSPVLYNASYCRDLQRRDMHEHFTRLSYGSTSIHTLHSTGFRKDRKDTVKEYIFEKAVSQALSPMINQSNEMDVQGSQKL